jgi:putative membrane protein
MMGRLNNIQWIKILITVWYLVGVAGFTIEPLRTLFQFLTPFGMLAATILLLAFHEPRNFKSGLIFATIAISGFVVELIGVNTGILFGTYEYGPTLGLKIWNTPLTIGLNWLVLVYCVASLLRPIRDNWYFPVAGAMAMVAFDWIMEPVAVATEMWSWSGAQIPLKNYLDWFLVSGALFLIIRIFKVELNNRLAGWLLLMQAVFFLLLNLLTRTPLWVS